MQMIDAYERQKRRLGYDQFSNGEESEFPGQFICGERFDRLGMGSGLCSPGHGFSKPSGGSADTLPLRSGEDTRQCTCETLLLLASPCRLTALSAEDRAAC